MKPPSLLAVEPVMMKATGAIVELSQSAGGGPQLIQLIKTPSPAHATCAVCQCVLRRGIFQRGAPEPPRA